MRNLEERIKVDQLKEALEEIFSEFGNVLEIVAKTNLKAKGQAFIVFDDVEAATRAIDEVNGFELFEKPMVLDYAKSRSDATVRREGGTDELETHKRWRLAEKGMSQNLSQLGLLDHLQNLNEESVSLMYECFTQSDDKPTTPSKLKRNSNDPPLHPNLHARPRL